MQNNLFMAMHPVGRNVRLIILNMCIILQEYPTRSCNFGGSYYGCCLMMHISFCLCCQGAKKVIVTLFTSPNIFSTSPKMFLMSRIDFTVLFFFWNSTKNFTCLLGKLRTEFTSPIAKSTSPGLSDTTFFARWLCVKIEGLKMILISVYRNTDFCSLSSG